MKCPYQDIGCWYIDDVSHICEATSKSDCRHLNNDPEPEQKNKKQKEQEDEL